MARTGYHSGGSESESSGLVRIVPLTRIQSLGWEHYEVHEPEPHILLFK